MARGSWIPLGACALCAACSAAEPSSPEASTPWTRDLPPAILGEGEVLEVRAPADVKLAGPRVEAKPGDFVLRNQGVVAVVGLKTGTLVDFGASGGADDLNEIAPTAYLGFEAGRAEVVSVERAGAAGNVVHVVRRLYDIPVYLHTWFSLRERTVLIETALQAATKDGAGVVAVLGERVAWGNVPTWVGGHGFHPASGEVHGGFLARESLGVSYALAPSSGRLLATFSAGSVPGFYPGARTGEAIVVVPPAGLSERRTIRIATSTSSFGHAVSQVIGSYGQTLDMPKNTPPGARVDVGFCSLAGGARTPFARFAPSEGKVRLPDACFEVRLVAPGHAPTAWAAATSLPNLELPKPARLVVRASEGGKPVPVRVQVRGLDSTPSPDWGDDPDAGAALNMVHTETGSIDRSIPAGRHRVLVDRGFEYELVSHVVQAVGGETIEIDAPMQRSVDTSGYVSADLHLHANPSPDAPQSLADRVRALAACGVEVGVATDHNVVTDYAPTIRELGVGAFVASVVGDEVTTASTAFGHFNVFPLLPGSEPLAFEHTNPAALFAEARARAPLGKDTLVQVNHPRMGSIGYFDIVRFDRDDVPWFQKQSPAADLSFDAIEIYNGDEHVAIWAVEDTMRDWYALLDVGMRVTATGNSDSHKLTFHEAGLPRTYVEVGSDDPSKLDVAAFTRALQEGRAIVSGGPFVRLEIGDARPGGSVRAGTHEVTVRVGAPTYIDVARIEIVVRGRVVAFQDAPRRGAAGFELRAPVELAKGDWVIAIARGAKEMEPLFRRGGYPFSFTNPIRVDGD